jgi:hypothetical protein
MDQLVKVKDDIIWNLILDKKKARDEEISIMNQKHLQEITELKKYYIYTIGLILHIWKKLKN